VRLAALVQRLAQSLVVLLGASLIVFILLRVAPGDPATILLGEQATPDAVRELRTTLGLDQPLFTQYVKFLERIVVGDLGTSIRAQRPVLDMLLERVPATVELTALAILIAVLIGIPIGVISAARPGSVLDESSLLFGLLAQSIPGFWLGLMMISVFAVQLRVLPVAGRGTAAHLVMPTIALAFYVLGMLIRLARAGMLDVLKQEYITAARARGLHEAVVVLKHGLRNALIPIAAVLGLQTGTLLGGAVVTEAVFQWPGIGGLAVVALAHRDYPVIQAIVLFSAVSFVLINLLVDAAYQVIDPRMRIRA
jgi:peptide/nickel transport system permease protein/oligopeptide transport system permease protein